MSVFAIKIKELAPTSFLITHSYRVRGIYFWGCRGIIPKCLLSPYGFKQTFYYKMESKTME
ncbi:hypothetical protein AOA79_0207100 [Helicobacter pylori]|nr:hypothetical protein AOD78_0206790 [Helicobacter pylori]OKB17156.1 hypothetical protein AOA79_0207100 [Helicobacter pylori]OKB19478.1 hypothetical protein AOD75_0206880 [Helicobacter pylori]